MPEQMFQSDFVNRADAVTNLHINYVRQATADLNAIMASLRQVTGVTVPTINPLAAESEPSQVNFVPSKDVVAVFADDYQGIFSDVTAWFGEMKKNAAADFPFLDNAASDDADAWMVSAISGEVIKLAEDAELARGRSRAVDEATRAKQVAAGGYSALGYILPSGGLLAAQQEADFAANRAVYELNRDLTIKAQELRADLAKFAVGQVNALRSTAISSLNSYLNALVSLPNTAISYASQREKAQQDLWEAGRQYYAGQLAYKNLSLDGKKSNLQASISGAQLDVQVQNALIERDLKTLQVMSDVYGRLVAGAMAGINSHISLGANSNASTNYNLSGTYP